MIYVGYQGIGKSTLSGKNNYIDLESANFWVDGERVDNWYKIYANIAKHLSDQGYNVFTSSHKILRDYFNECGIEFYAIYPSLEMKEFWVDKLKTRYELDGEEKHYKAWKNAECMFEENIKDLQQENNTIEINDPEYVLSELIKNRVD